MAYIFGFGDGILISFGIILVSIVLCILNGRSKGLSSVITYVIIAALFLATLFLWPIKSADEPTPIEQQKTDIVLIPRVVYLIFLPFFMIYLINLFVRHNLFNVVRTKSTVNRHGKPWLAEAKVKNS
ncbi:uncharacterized protein CELE_T23E7.5 [Caenorhabditis elegans]|uniref:TMEM (Human TransMEMbrane protein) homolog n=1 Tax=Caenorhabditis elegans TaxID=6239 RepID=Q2A955_CAEEL|nr:uncharacterized protein CELE_T23E7.5 [Caenorhabditis elegans]CCD83567.1 TMEM (human TransMEMbrane protein) homolog [Caenorhabditis elegans]|eukprot:NP_001041291.1 TMEM (human TransMEMbrane protein) homolog [Caenorhabditis elegans]